MLFCYLVSKAALVGLLKKQRTESIQSFQMLNKISFSLQGFLRLCFSEIINCLEGKQAGGFEIA